nr:uncharacterized protein LOC117453483 [Pseudochaenichthys georgianus]
MASLGTEASRPATQRLGENVVLRLVEPFVGKGRNITTDNFFTSLPLAKALLDKMVLSVYQCKPRRNVTMLSTQHQHVAISTERKKKPETVEYYNHSKVGVDVLDQMARQYSVKGGTRRWPVAVFYNVLDLAAISAWVLRSCMSQRTHRDGSSCSGWHTSCALSGWHQKADLPFSGAEERRRMACMVKAHCMQNKTFCKCVTCGDAVCGERTAKGLSVCEAL